MSNDNEGMTIHMEAIVSIENISDLSIEVIPLIVVGGIIETIGGGIEIVESRERNIYEKNQNKRSVTRK